jgi:putative transposase
MIYEQTHPGYKKKAHSVYLLTYHIVFVTKYRRPVITDEIGDYMKAHAAYLCGRFNGEMLSAETDRDHIHLLVSMPPDVTPSRLIGTLKTQLSKEVRANFQEHIQKYLWGDAPFWSNSYFIASTGTTSLEKVREYIENQRTEEHKRKYIKSGKYSRKRNT